MDLSHVIIFGVALGLSSGAGVLNDSVNAAVGDTVMFTTTVPPTQMPFTSIEWTFDTKPIITSTVNNITAPEYEDRITLFISTGSLELRNVIMKDSGQYHVNITEGSDVMSGVTTLTVYEIISDAVITSVTQIPVEGTSTLNLTCDASGSISSREWRKNGLTLKPSENIVFYEENRVLSFKPLSRTDSGRYSCVISNPVSSQEATYGIVVIYGPEHVQIAGPNKVQIETTFKLSCAAESVPAASYLWIKNGTTVAHSSEYSKNVSEDSDSGEYVCEATNEISMKTSDTSHTITVSPKDSLSAGAIAGIAIACLVVCVGAAVGGVFLYKYLTGKKQKNNSLEDRKVSKKPNLYTDEEDQNVYENVSNIYNKDL